jgi:hypothetical protein
MERYYFENTGKGTFVDKALQLGIAYGENGQGVASMGPVIGDLDHNGLLDIFVPDLSYCSLLMQGPRGFKDKTATAGLSVVMGQYAGWAAILFDYDNDGWLDILTVHGNAHHEYVQEDTLVRNKRDGTFEDISRQSGQYFFEKYVGRGGTWADVDNDGDIDVVIVNLNDEAKVLRNDGGNKNNWLNVRPRLKFPTGMRDAVGARVTVTAGSLKQFDDVMPTRGYLGQGDPRLQFGLGKATEAEVEIRWPGGTVEKLGKVTANQFLTPVREAKAGGAK